MWERFELLWTAFEKFALFFSFIATLVILAVVVLIYNQAANLEPSPEPIPVEPVIRALNDGFAKIQGAVLSTEVVISHTVPMMLDIRFNPSRTGLEIVEGSRIRAGEVTINLRDGAGTLVGQGATLDVSAGNSFQVKMDFSKRIVFDVPLRLSVPVTIPLGSLNLMPELAALQAMTTSLDAEVTATLEAASDGSVP